MTDNTDKQRKKSFVLYLDYVEIISELTDEQAGKLLKAIYDFLLNGVELESKDGMLRIAWKQIRNTLLRDAEKYDKQCEENARKSKMGGIISQIKSGNRISDESIMFIAQSRIGKQYLVKQDIPQNIIEDVWNRVEKWIEHNEHC